MIKKGSTKILNFLTPGAGVLVLRCDLTSYIVKIHYFFLNLLLYSWTIFRQTKCIVMMTEEGSTKIVNFMIPGVGVLVLRCGHISYIIKIHLLYSQAQIRQTEGIVMMSKEGSTKILDFMTPRAGILVLGCGQISHIVKMHYIFKNLFIFTQA